MFAATASLRRFNILDTTLRYNGIAGLVNRVGPDRLAVFDITATLDDAFLNNLMQTLDSVAASKVRVSVASGPGPWQAYYVSGACDHLVSRREDSDRKLRAVTERFREMRLPSLLQGVPLSGSDRGSDGAAKRYNDPRSANEDGDSSFCLPFMDRTPGTATIYRFSNVDHELTQYLPWGLRGGSFDVQGELNRGGIKLPNLEIAVLDKGKSELQIELAQGHAGGSHDTALDSKDPCLLYYPMGRGVVLLRQRTFSVVMRISDDALRQADSIRVRLVR
jgi:hypothetical protein